MDNFLCSLYEAFISIIDSKKRLEVWLSNCPYRHISVHSFSDVCVAVLLKIVLRVKIYHIINYLLNQSQKSAIDISN